jgi:hypothetical protein
MKKDKLLETRSAAITTLTRQVPFITTFTDDSSMISALVPTKQPVSRKN